MFVYRCLRIKNKNKPLSSRCKKKVDNNNGLLCSDCFAEAQHNTIPMLMHNDVTKKLHIPFKNQIFVEINLGNSSEKPKLKNAKERQEKEIKGTLTQDLNTLTIKQLVDFSKALDLDIANELKKIHSNEYSLRYHLVKEIIHRLISNSIL